MVMKIIYVILSILALAGGFIIVIAMGAYIALMVGMRYFNDLEDWTDEEEDSC